MTFLDARMPSIASASSEPRTVFLAEGGAVGRAGALGGPDSPAPPLPGRGDAEDLPKMSWVGVPNTPLALIPR